MRVIWAFIWSFLLVQMMSYVISAMTPGGTYDFGQASIFSVILTVLVIAIGALIPNEPAQQH
ncbi:YjzD family protein [Bacillus multifaciens]|uniref:YjzD family protein n=1 Tax=Bacillus multifaciens TaxID=3068506 RepID=UPI00274182C8|nr:YjzD family protein [Bacillus sp. WLY-B-L8]MDP7977568.1 YjzD family protein [Bacillus sp. WLY-B-L8]HDX9588273.1 YjzD family protein [Bacillus pseudomycoides]